MSPAQADTQDDPGVRSASRQLATGVCVLTTAHGSRVHGSTVSAASVVTQSPLTLCMSLRRDSFFVRLALEAGRIACNVLSSRQALIADWFANPGRPPGLRQFEAVPWDPAPGSGIPLLRDALARLHCAVTRHVPVGDHDVLLLGEVTGGDTSGGRPLVSFGAQLYGAELHEVSRRRGWREATAAAVQGLH